MSPAEVGSQQTVETIESGAVITFVWDPVALACTYKYSPDLRAASGQERDNRTRGGTCADTTVALWNSSQQALLNRADHLSPMHHRQDTVQPRNQVEPCTC